MKELDDSEDSYDDQDESDSVHESELGDTLDVNEITRDVHFDRESDETPKQKRTESGQDGKIGSESGEEELESGMNSKENAKSNHNLKQASQESKMSGKLPKRENLDEGERSPGKKKKD